MRTFLLLTVICGSILLSLVGGQSLQDAANCFTLNFYKKLAVNQTNIISSPFSADVLLSMLLIGARGSTADDLNKTLGYKDLAVADIERDFKSKLSALKSSGVNTLDIANSFWLEDNFKINQRFTESATQNFNVALNNVDFQRQPQQATLAINNWVNETTHGLIPKLFDQDLDTNTIMVWVNTIYFKGQWAKKFNESNTQNANFYNENSASVTKQVPLMNLLQRFKYKFDTTLQAQILEMEYVGNDISMIVVLPKKGSRFADMENVLTCESFKTGVLSSGSEKLVDVTLPKFDASSNFDLIKPLQDIGLGIIFDKPDLSGITEEDIYVSKAIQKATIKVSEDGSEAAAATALVFTKSYEIDKTEVFRADHPFLYLIRHNPTDLVLFIGRMWSSE